MLYANRSFAHLRQESFGYALTDAQTAIKSDTAYLKGEHLKKIYSDFL